MGELAGRLTIKANGTVDATLASLTTRSVLKLASGPHLVIRLYAITGLHSGRLPDLVPVKLLFQIKRANIPTLCHKTLFGVV